MPNWLTLLLTAVITVLLKNASPMIRDKIKEFLGMLEKKAKETDNPVDDLLVDFLKRIFRINDLA
ncbi:hypothetical protein ES703_32302 [subsurface metagenome]